MTAVKCCRLTSQLIDKKPCFFCTKPANVTKLTATQRLDLLREPVTIEINESKCATCSEFTTDCSRAAPPPLKQRIVTYAGAVKEWVAAGNPTRSSVEVKQLLKICQACSAYNKGVCNTCGCRVTNSEWSILNKIKMKTQHCPRKKW